LVKLQGFSDWLTPVVAHVVPDWLGYQIAGSLLAIFPTAVLMGVAFPIGLRLLAEADESPACDRAVVARRIGQFYSMNVGGAILGSLAAGFLLLPAIGSSRSLTLLAATCVVSAMLLLSVAEWRRPARLLAGALGAIVFAAAVFWSPD